MVWSVFFTIEDLISRTELAVRKGPGKNLYDNLG